MRVAGTKGDTTEGTTMADLYGTTTYLRLEGSINSGTFTWTSKTVLAAPFPGNVVDRGEDGNLDIGVDDYLFVTNKFSGYYYTTPDGTDYPIFSDGGFYYVPFVIGEYNLTPDSVFPASGSTSSFSDNAEIWMCFAAGTRIATPTGEAPVETLGIGDRVLTREGRAVTVKWIGRQTVSTRFGPAERLMPVRFAIGSLGEGLPHADLTVTADHGMLVDGVICHAGALVNGTTITRVPLSEMGETYTVYHIETEDHEIILANGAPAETFIDNVSRCAFDNYAEFEALYGDVPEMEELPYPRAMSARQVPERIRAKLRILKTA
ncbi:Hint domain-containing protein [Nioella ostreopsis]|uniref:Hint domain-containing protein n=1 Tax=Nioella ostreopsis TaxID=2448479 RepID=UPI000FD6BA77|nr:Hint domain-containing protein [Nioella ostreopsis]